METRQLYNQGDAFIPKTNSVAEPKVITSTSTSYKTCVMDFKKNGQYRITLEDYKDTTSNIEVFAHPDKTDTSTRDSICYLKKGNYYLFVPSKDYEMLRWGVGGVSKMVIEELDPTERHEFHCGSGCEFTTLKDAITEAEKWMNSTVYVGDGTYDIVEEMGDEYFAGITSANSMPGLKLQNKIHLVFSPLSKVVCNYTGSNEWVMKNFSPFNAGQFGFTLENMTFFGSRTRYAVHDEYNGLNQFCQSRYLNCEFHFDNTDGMWTNTIIGGGLSSNTVVEIEGCSFDVADNADGSEGASIYYHQSNKTAITNFKSILRIENNYIVKGKISFQMSRENSENPTIIFVNGNSVRKGYSGKPYYAEGTGLTYNVIRSWGNEIRG